MPPTTSDMNTKGRSLQHTPLFIFQLQAAIRARVNALPTAQATPQHSDVLQESQAPVADSSPDQPPGMLCRRHSLD